MNDLMNKDIEFSMFEENVGYELLAYYSSVLYPLIYTIVLEL